MNTLQKADGFERQHLFVIPQAQWAPYQALPTYCACLVTDIGHFPHANSHYRNRPDGCDEHILLLCTAGEGYYALRGSEAHRLQAGEAVVLPAHVAHTYGTQDKNPWSIYFFHFHAGDTSSLNALLLRTLPTTLDLLDIAQAVQLFQRCFALLKRPHQHEEYFALCQYALSILALLQLRAKHAETPISPKGNQAIEAGLNYMKENLSKPLTLQELSLAVNFSPSHLSALFKTATGHSPMEYFMHMKMQDASRALYFTDAPIHAIAAMYGLEDACYFSRVFKKHIGMSPLQYRKFERG